MSSDSQQFFGNSSSFSGSCSQSMHQSLNMETELEYMLNVFPGKNWTGESLDKACGQLENDYPYIDLSSSMTLENMPFGTVELDPKKPIFDILPLTAKTGTFYKFSHDCLTAKRGKSVPLSIRNWHGAKISIYVKQSGLSGVTGPVKCCAKCIETHTKKSYFDISQCEKAYFNILTKDNVEVKWDYTGNPAAIIKTQQSDLLLHIQFLCWNSCHDKKELELVMDCDNGKYLQTYKLRVCESPMRDHQNWLRKQGLVEDCSTYQKLPQSQIPERNEETTRNFSIKEESPQENAAINSTWHLVQLPELWQTTVLSVIKLAGGTVKTIHFCPTKM